MPYAKAHPFGYKPVKRTNKTNNANTTLYHRQTVIEVSTYKVMQRRTVWERDPQTGKTRMKLVPVYEGIGKNRKPVFDEFLAVQHRVILHYGRPRKGRTLAEMVYETFPFNEGK